MMLKKKKKALFFMYKVQPCYTHKCTHTYTWAYTHHIYDIKISWEKVSRRNVK